MQASFRAYVDESGDEGFAFRASPSMQASSDWFVLAVFITHKRTDLETVKIVDRVRKELQRHPKKHIHWKDLKHAEKVRYAQLISELQARTIAVCVHKPSLLEPEMFRQRYRLYFYAVRYLVERISWLARDKHNFNALEKDRFGNTECRYLKILSGILYRYNGRHMGHGLKIVPREAAGNWPPSEDLRWLR